MTRRKQAQPRAFKPEEDTASPSADVARTPDGDRPESGLDLPALPETGVNAVSCRWCCQQLVSADEVSQHLTSECPGPGSDADLSTDSQSISSEVSLTSGSPGSSAELDSLVTIGATEATPYKCCFCEQAYPRQTLMKLHEQTHTDQLPFECEYCGHRFKHKRSKDRHVKLHTGEKKFKCKYCPSAYCRSDHLKIHMRTHDSQKPYQCSVCNRGYRTAAALTSHLQKHKDREAAAAAAAAAGDRQPQPYRCLKCAATYPSGEALQEHVQAAHGGTPRPPKTSSAGSPGGESAAGAGAGAAPPLPPPPPPGWDEWSCPYCDRPSRFSNVEALSYHIQTLHMPLMMPSVESPLLGYGLPLVPLKAPLSPIHLVSPPAGDGRTSVKPFTCMLCSAAVPDAAALIKHIQTAHAAGASPAPAPAPPVPAAHSESKRSPAPAEQPTDLSRRAKRARSNGEPASAGPAAAGGAESPVICSLCGQPFTEFEAYRVHFQTTHLDGAAAAPLACDQCGQQFSAAAQLETHLASHLQVTAVRYACQRCQRSYRTADELQKHLTDRHAQTLFKCTICHATFDSRVDVQVHFAVSHSDELRVHSCSACGEEFSDEPAFMRHLRAVHMSAAKSFPCLLCGQHFDQLSAYKQHVQKHQRNFQCKICGEAFYVEFQLDRHVQTAHARELKVANGEPRPPPKKQRGGEALPAPPPPLQFALPPVGLDVDLNPAFPSARHKCNICDSVQPTARSLAEHKLVHCKVVHSEVCAVCKGAVRSAAGYRQHMQQHSAPSFPVSCVICQQTLVSDVEVGIHAEFHLRRVAASPPTPQQQQQPAAAPAETAAAKRCSQCAVKFETAAEAEGHVCAARAPARRELYQCLMCQQTYSDQEQIREHIATHLLENASHACNLCQLTFDTPLKLQIHLIEHNFEGCGSYSCYICSAVFTAAAGLQKHMVEHGIEVKPFDCQQCHQRFFFRTELDNHGFLHRIEGSVRRVAAGSPAAGAATAASSAEPATASSRESSKAASRDSKSSPDVAPSPAGEETAAPPVDAVKTEDESVKSEEPASGSPPGREECGEESEDGGSPEERTVSPRGDGSGSGSGGRCADQEPAAGRPAVISVHSV
ncbi:zinc finger protein 423 homolog isoform X1 [Amphibalanus amphitrite]|uniref:zinc finger protein 423 homolog isoform X1 n=2 Tax=Amphibalanus amphitrite TaxID=1232801 RepID=UPI001C90FC66|nr:zinc finger protein 423 homolog isoform X1 [Amphibalanus amphitrite]